MFEILYRLNPIPRLEKIEDLDSDDYMMVPGNTRESTLPLPEFDGPFQVYVMIKKHWKKMGLPREIREYDIINMVCIYEYDPEIRPVNLLMMRKAENMHLVYVGATLRFQKGKPLALLPVRGMALPSFRN